VNVFSEEDADGQLFILRAIASGDLHNWSIAQTIGLFLR
jgi:hypothetical protein